jgi:hypothetical protein
LKTWRLSCRSTLGRASTQDLLGVFVLELQLLSPAAATRGCPRQSVQDAIMMSPRGGFSARHQTIPPAIRRLIMRREGARLSRHATSGATTLRRSDTGKGQSWSPFSPARIAAQPWTDRPMSFLTLARRASDSSQCDAHRYHALRCAVSRYAWTTGTSFASVCHELEVRCGLTHGAVNSSEVVTAAVELLVSYRADFLANVAAFAERRRRRKRAGYRRPSRHPEDKLLAEPYLGTRRGSCIGAVPFLPVEQDPPGPEGRPTGGCS